MTSGSNQSVRKALRLFDVLRQEHFRPKSFNELMAATGIPGTTAWRLMKSLEAEGWAECLEDGPASVWRVGVQLKQLAHAHRRSALEQIHHLENEYYRISGEELRG